MSKKAKPPVYRCPKCDSQDVFSTHEQAFMVNSGEHYCHMVKAHDSDSKAGCLQCNWRGERHELKEHNK